MEVEGLLMASINELALMLCKVCINEGVYTIQWKGYRLNGFLDFVHVNLVLTTFTHRKGFGRLKNLL